MTLIKQRQITAAVRFRGGATTMLTLPRPLSAPQLRATDPAVREQMANEVRSVSAQGESRLIRAVPAATVGRSVYAVHGSRVAWWEMQGDSSFLMLTENATATPRALVAVPGHFSGALELAWSWNGRRLASYWPPAANQNAQPLMLIDVPAAGARATPRLIPTGAQYYYYPKWLPDDSGLVMVAGYGMGVQSHILHVPIGEGAQLLLSLPYAAGLLGFAPALLWDRR